MKAENTNVSYGMKSSMDPIEVSPSKQPHGVLSEQDKQRIENKSHKVADANKYHPDSGIRDVVFHEFYAGANYEHSHISDLLSSQSKEIEQMVQSAQNYVNGEKARYEEFCRMQKEIELLRNTYNALDKAHQTSSDNVQTLLKEIAELKEALRRTIDFVEEDNDDAQYRHDLIEEIEQLLK